MVQIKISIRSITMLLIFLLLFLINIFLYSSTRENIVIDSKKDEQIFIINFISTTLSNYYKDTGKYPTSEEGLEILVINKNKFSKDEPYINFFLIKKDVWGEKYIYLYPVKNWGKEYKLCSSGGNKIYENGNGDDICYR